MLGCCLHFILALVDVTHRGKRSEITALIIKCIYAVIVGRFCIEAGLSVFKIDEGFARTYALCLGQLLILAIQRAFDFAIGITFLLGGSNGACTGAACQLEYEK